LAVLLLGLLGWRGWSMWQAREHHARATALEAEQRIGALEQRLDALRRDQRAQAQRILDAAATNRVLRDEVLGLSQRGALLEDSVSKLADPTRHGAQALRLDEVELLLSQAQQRLAIADDLDGARRAYSLADGALQGIDDPRLLNLRQALAQERAALEALGNGPHAAIARRLDAFAAGLGKLPEQSPVAQSRNQAVWQRLLSPLVEVRPTESKTVIAPTARSAGEAALQIELGLARAALERDDADGFHAAIGRMDAWLVRLWPASPALQQRRSELKALRAIPLQPTLPVLGSTLQQLRQLRNSGYVVPPALSTTTASRPTAEIER
jgi:uroporphyrin-3 C-methyltransferase